MPRVSKLMSNPGVALKYMPRASMSIPVEKCHSEFAMTAGRSSETATTL